MRKQSMPEKMIDMITKTNFLSFIQCQKRLWLELYSPEKAKSKTPADIWKFVRGREVGELTRKFFSGGILIESKDKVIAFAQTKEVIKNNTSIIFEASFLADDCYAAIDVLRKNNNGNWDIIEVKSATSLKDEHIADVAFQKFIATTGGVKIDNCIPMHLNKENVYPNTDDLFVQEDITKEVNKYIQLISEKIALFNKATSAMQEPDILFDKQCKKPHECLFKSYCWQDVIKLPNLQLPKQIELYAIGIHSYEDIPIDYELSPRAQATLNQIRSNEITIKKQQIKNKLSALEYPLHFLDFEFDNPALPRFDGFHPYEEFPFQFSCHVLDERNKITHHEFIQDKFSDPRLELIEHLLGCIGNHWHVIAWNIKWKEKY